MCMRACALYTAVIWREGGRREEGGEREGGREGGRREGWGELADLFSLMKE